MSTQIILSDLFVDLSTAQQQLLTGGQQTESDDLMENMGLGSQGSNDGQGSSGGALDGQDGSTTNLPVRRYRINKTSTSIISVQRLS